MINYNCLEDKIQTFCETFKNAKPFPHLVIDNFLELEVAQKACDVFPTMSKMDTLKDIRQYKAQDPDLSKFDQIFSEIIFDHLHSTKMLNFLEEVTSIKSLLPDSQLYASGLAQATDGSFLNVHIDNSSHPIQPWYRRLNLLVYLNPNWSEEKGGHLELWSKDMGESVAILPIFNRAVIFATNAESWHGHRIVSTTDGDTRKSINIYYFTEKSPTGQDYYHITSFRARNKEFLNKLVYPIDNFFRSTFRKIRPKKDSHAVLFEKDQDH